MSEQVVEKFPTHSLSIAILGTTSLHGWLGPRTGSCWTKTFSQAPVPRCWITGVYGKWLQVGLWRVVTILESSSMSHCRRTNSTIGQIGRAPFSITSQSGKSGRSVWDYQSFSPSSKLTRLETGFAWAALTERSFSVSFFSLHSSWISTFNCLNTETKSRLTDPLRVKLVFQLFLCKCFSFIKNKRSDWYGLIPKESDYTIKTRVW